MLKLVAYYRVSTERQGRSGLGLEGQERAVELYRARENGRLIRAFTEVESGKKDDRPELAAALAACRRSKARLVVAKLDRVSRNARFLLTLVESKVDIAFCELPQIPPGAMGKFFLTMMAGVAELERGLISERTKAALAAYKARGHVSRRVRSLYPGGVPPEVVEARAGRLGAQLPECKNNLSDEGRRKGQARGRAANLAAARAHAAGEAPLVLELHEKGMTLRAIAAELNARGSVTRRNKPWTSVAVLRLLNRARG